MTKRSNWNKVIRFWKKLGPGLITGASDDDPSGIATYSQAGAQFGLSTLWTALITFPLMAAVQEMCARIGMVTSKGLTGTLKEHYSRAGIVSDAFIQLSCHCDEYRCKYCRYGCCRKPVGSISKCWFFQCWLSQFC
jgi:Mn2+/Fe2+ NRAMP family transporter